jgi:hypothetical protein
VDCSRKLVDLGANGNYSYYWYLIYSYY